jgi:FMN phosphatase YigB (HAD superfamily)
VVLLDMNSTFMFGENRLGPDEDFAATYRAAGGRALRPDTVATAVLACVAHMARLYDDPARADDFPGVLEVMGELPDVAELPERERSLLAEVMARHELGRIPEPHADAVRDLARTHRLGVVANIWAPKDLWLAELARARLADVFAARVFSSDSRSMKPSPRLFHEAPHVCGVRGPGPHSHVVHIGDSLRCDVGGAQAAGLRTIWVNPARTAPPADGPQPDAWVADLRDLVTHCP